MTDGLTPGTTPISDEHMFEMLGKTKTYTLVLLKSAEKYGTPEAKTITFEHARRNFALRAEGVLSIVCPVMDDTDLCGIGIFDGTAEEVAAIMDGDPGVQAGVFTYEVHPVRSFPGDSLA